MITLSALLSIGAMSCLTSFKDSLHVHTHNEKEEQSIKLDEENHSKTKLSTFSSGDGKVTKYFNITTEIGINETNKVIGFNNTLSNITEELSTPSFTFYYNNEPSTTYSILADGALYFVYGDYTPSTIKNDTENYYSHYQIKAGTTIFKHLQLIMY